MGGTIDVYSEYTKGSVFTVTLPQLVRSGDVLASVKNPGEKKVLVFEHRDIYAKSIISTLENLGVYCALASDEKIFSEKLSECDWTYVFIAAQVYEKVKELLANQYSGIKAVLGSMLGENIPYNNITNLSLPVYSTAVARLLNNDTEIQDDEERRTICAFTASDAVILVVDDIVTNLNVAKGLLKPYKVDVDICKSGKTAIEMVKTNRYDLIFMDHRMPDMDGVETTRRIRSLENEDSRYADIPIVALTADVVSGMKEMFLEKGFNDFLSKPIDTAELNAVLKKWIPQNKQREEAAFY